MLIRFLRSSLSTRLVYTPEHGGLGEWPLANYLLYQTDTSPFRYGRTNYEAPDGAGVWPSFRR
jgi:hypothetical protein